MKNKRPFRSLSTKQLSLVHGGTEDPPPDADACRKAGGQQQEM